MLKNFFIALLVLLPGAIWAVALLRASYLLYTESRAYEWSSNFLTPASRFDKFLNDEELAFKFYNLAIQNFFWQLIFKPKSFPLNIDMKEYYDSLLGDFK